MRKLADVVTSLWLGNIVLPKELFNVISLHGNILLKLIFGINEGVSVKHIVDFYFNTDRNSTG